MPELSSVGPNQTRRYIDLDTDGILEKASSCVQDILSYPLALFFNRTHVQVSSFALCGAFAVGVVCACVVALFLFLNHTFDTSNAKRVKGAKIVAVTAILFNGIALIVMSSAYLMIIEWFFLLCFYIRDASLVFE